MTAPNAPPTLAEQIEAVAWAIVELDHDDTQVILRLPALRAAAATLRECRPREPTLDMVDAGINNDCADASIELCRVIWRAMWDAYARAPGAADGAERE